MTGRRTRALKLERSAAIIALPDLESLAVMFPIFFKAVLVIASNLPKDMIVSLMIEQSHMFAAVDLKTKCFKPR